jgi:DUF4097 and DUF4098 domain-containing protein YvlB
MWKVLDIPRRLKPVLLIALTAAAHGQTGAIVREDGYWVQNVALEYAIGNAGELWITTRGPVTLHAGEAPALRVNLRKRVRAASEAEARRVFDEVRLRFDGSPRLAHVRLNVPSRSMPSPELQVAVPRAVARSVVATESGALDLRGLRGEIEVSTGGGRIHADSIDGALTARTGGGEIRIGSVAGVLRCVTGGGPVTVRRAEAETWIDTGGGEILVEEAQGPVHASTGAGNVEVRRAFAAVNVRTAGGQIRVFEARGLVTAESAGGGIQIGSARGVRLASVGGGIKLQRISGEMRVSTAVGSILAELLSGSFLGNSYLSTGSGDVTVVIPSNLAVTVQAHNDSPGRYGRIVSDFPEVRVQAAAAQARGRVVAEGAINGGGPILTIAAADGTIFLRRLK